MTSVDYKIEATRLQVIIRAQRRAGRYAAIKEHIKHSPPGNRLPMDKLRLVARGHA